MAVSIEAAFVLIDRASGPLKKIERQAIATDKALRGMGTGGGGLAGSTTTSKLNSFKDALHEGRKEMSALGGETAKTAKKVDVFSRLFNRTIKPIKDWVKALRSTHPVLAGTAGALGGVLGGLKGLAGALPKVVWAALLLTPVIISLAGAIGALASSLAGAVGGGALLGGGLLGSFAVGLGSIAAIAKPAITATQNYQKAVKNLNTALASGSPTAIKARQKELNAIAKANPGVAKLSGNLRKFQSEWKKATAPGRASFFKLAADGIQTLRDLLPTLAGEANKNTAALQTSFQKILAPFMRSDTFKGFISGLGGIFRANLPGFMTGLVNVFKGLASILKVLTPQLDRAGPSFAKFTGHFAKWAASAGGKSTIREMGRAFSAWLDLVKQIARVIGSVVGAGMKPGTDQVSKWADKMSGFADKLKKPAAKGSMANFFQRSLDDVDKLYPLLKKLADSFSGIYDVLKPLGGTTKFILQHLPTPAITALALGYLGIKMTKGAVSGAQSVWKLFKGPRDGSSVAKSLYVTPIGGGGGGGSALSKAEKQAVKDAERGGEGGFVTRLLSKLKLIPGESALGGEASAFGAELPGMGPAIAAVAVGAGTVFLTAQGIKEFSKLTVGGVPGQPHGPFSHGRWDPDRHGWTGPSVAAQPHQTPSRVQPSRYGPVGGTNWSPNTRSAPPAHPVFHAANTPSRAAPGFHPSLAYARQLALAGSVISSKGLDADLSTLPSRLKKKLTDPFRHATRKVQNDFIAMASQAGGSLKDIQSVADLTGANIRKQLPKDSAEANQAVAANYAIAAADVQTSMNKHVISVSTAMAAIAKLMAKAFEALGIKSGVAKKLGEQGWSLAAVQGGISSGQQSGLTGSSDPNASTTGRTSYQFRAPAGHETGGRLPGPPRGDHLPLMSRGGKLLGIADGGELVVNRHTEARADKYLASFGTRLSDMVSNETTPHTRGGRTSTKRGFATGGRVPAFATGGRTLSYGQLEGLWTGAGGPANLASLAAAVAEAESSGVASARNPSGASGLWQILGVPFPGDPFDPQTNARMAVAKWRGAGGFSPWVAYTSGAYRKFLHGGVPAMGGGGGGGGGGMAVPVLKPPHVKGSGAVVAYGQEVINRITQGANAYLQAHAPAGGGTVPSGAGGTARDPSGKLVAGWIEPILAWARGHGWSGSVTSGYRSYAQQASIYNSGVRPAARPGTSNHEGTQFPRGAVDVSGAAQLSSILSRSPYASTLVWAGGKDPVHFSHPHGGSYALGGRVPWYAKGADFVANRPQVIGVGDAPGGERVTVTPKGQGRIGNQGLHVEIHKIEVHRKGDIQKIVDEELGLLATTIESRL